MRYIFDHDLHIHTQLSPCSANPLQTPETILAYAKENNLKTVVTTDHYWDERIHSETEPYGIGNEAIHSWGPYPQADGIRLLIGAETDIDYNGVIGADRRTCENFDLMLISATHMHMDGFTCHGNESQEERAKIYIQRFDTILNADLPFHKIGFSHPVTDLIGDNHCAILDMIPDSEFRRVFKKSADLGMGIEINLSSMCEGSGPDYVQFTPQSHPAIFRPYHIAKEMGCKFYFGSDAHNQKRFPYIRKMAETVIDQLSLEESDKFVLK